MEKVKIVYVKSSHSQYALSELEQMVNAHIRENQGSVSDVKINIFNIEHDHSDLFVATIIFRDPFDIVRLEGH